jgi:heavy metal sensor kinase
VKVLAVQRLWQRKKRRLPLRLRLALWSGGLMLVVSFTLVLFINSIALSTFPRIIRLTPLLPVKIERSGQSAQPPVKLTIDGAYIRSLNPLERALLVELRSISLMGFGLIAILGGAGAYWLAGVALRPVRRVSKAAQHIGASTLDTRLALDGPKDEIKELADTFDAMLERLQHAFEHQGRFVADVAHELRTPLTSLRTNLEVVSTDPEATLGDYRAMAATQERALTRLEHLVTDLLILATSEQPLSCNTVSLGPLLEEVLCDLKHAAEARMVTLQLTGETEVAVQGDGSLLSRVFSNLVENGIYYNKPGGKVTITIDRKDAWVVVIVSDTGIGIAPEKQAHIFERFYREDSSRARHKGGAGLGLSIVSAIVQQHGGRVQVESTPNAGTIFSVLLPV